MKKGEGCGLCSGGIASLNPRTVAPTPLIPEGLQKINVQQVFSVSSLRDEKRGRVWFVFRGYRFAQPPANLGHPSGIRSVGATVRGYRFAQPPANLGHPSGMISQKPSFTRSHAPSFRHSTLTFFIAASFTIFYSAHYKYVTILFLRRRATARRNPGLRDSFSRSAPSQ